MNKHTPLIELRWTTFATLALCGLLLPGCPMTDNYFIDLSSGGSSQATDTGGATDVATSGSPSVGGLEGVGSTAGGPEVHPDHMGNDPVGGGGTASGAGMPYAGNNDAGSDVGGFGGSSGSGGLVSNGGTSSGGRAAGGSANGGNANAGTANGGNASGAANMAGNASVVPQPACDDGIGKNDPCGPSSLQLCYKGCGPDNVGYKPLACQGGVYQETQSGCTFPPGHDYSCYSVPPALPTECPSGVPRGGSPCSIAACKVCFGGSSLAPQYQDSTGIQKPGYCVCSDAGVWTCGTKPDAWPCPGTGCH